MRATIVNQTSLPARVLVTELPIPAGWVAESEALDVQLRSGVIAAYRLQAGLLRVCLRNAEPERALRVEYVLRAASPAKTANPVAWVYDFYAPERQAYSLAEPLEVTAKQ